MIEKVIEKAIENYYICIDFGTCNTVISYILDNNLIQIQENITGDILIPTTLYFISENITENIKIDDLKPNIHYIIGNSANDLINTNKDWEYYFFQFKRFLGITSKSIDIHKIFLQRYNFVYTTDEDTIYFYLKILNSDNKIKFSICDLIKLYFKALHNILIDKFNLDINENIPIMITCPAYFHDLQRSQLKHACENAGFKMIKLVNEPTAAAIFYIHRYNKTDISDKYIIYDLGGGTIDTTLIEYHSEDNTCEVIDIDGNNSLGGIDIDDIITYDIINRYSIDKTNIKWKNKIKKCAEEFKIKLSILFNYDIYLENVPILKNNEIIWIETLKISYSRHLFNNLINDIIDKMIQPIKTMYFNYNTKNIIFIGGPTQIPLLQSKINSLLDLNEMSDINLVNVINHDNNFHSNDLILYKTIVSQGGSILYKKIITKDNFCLLDIIPMNIGISDPDSKMIIMIEKNSKIPMNIEKIFTTSHDCQRTINIEIFEGINDDCNLNTFIGSYKIIGIPPLSTGMILIKLLFKISYNGILNISINGFKNSSDNSVKSFDFKLYENIKLIPNILAKEILRKILLNDKK